MDCSTPPVYCSQNKSDCLAQFFMYNKIRKCAINFFLYLGPVIPPQVPRHRGIGVVYNFVKYTIIPGVESELNFCANIYGASD